MNYNYSEFILNPKDLGAVTKYDGSSKTAYNQIGDYYKVLVKGASDAQAATPLGNAFFYDTGLKCLDEFENVQDRFMFVGNITYQNVEFPSQFGDYFNMRSTKGLLPGIINNINEVNNMSLLNGISEATSDYPTCKSVTLTTNDAQNNTSNETHFMALHDIEDIDPCNFPLGTNPVTNESCMEAFTSLNEMEEKKKKGKMPADFLSKLYLISLGGLMAYLVYSLLVKSKKKNISSK